ncbi:MAG: putative phosphotyrosine protein phosphatase [uncultured marine phage]|uniref:Putative phosphotyrosine protein phosphatase n=1 Tax=uncultured marine phage TaxID=707152 RepID=A0A8D9CCL1_9VIRU|nr:MAG: putative phosphotyrosine protein phosphatase [uncultured marine phage]
MKILFVCSVNKQRSRTADDYLTPLNDDVEIESAGTHIKSCFREGTNPLTDELLEWADHVYVMEKCHLDIIMKNSKNNHFKKITVLHIRDQYEVGSKRLIEKLKEKLQDSNLILE